MVVCHLNLTAGRSPKSSVSTPPRYSNQWSCKVSPTFQKSTVTGLLPPRSEVKSCYCGRGFESPLSASVCHEWTEVGRRHICPGLRRLVNELIISKLTIPKGHKEHKYPCTVYRPPFWSSQTCVPINTDDKTRLFSTPVGFGAFSQKSCQSRRSACKCSYCSL